MDVISTQGTSLLSVDLSGSDVTDIGLGLLKECSSLQALTFNHCENISEIGLKHISGNVLFLSWYRCYHRPVSGIFLDSSLTRYL